jgi:dTDP-4-amino-4,6-dideoxygalactose transaminase
MTALRGIADERGIALIEDCSQAYWAEFEGRLVGTMGDMACFSLQQSKHMTCGEGGLMVTSNAGYARRAQLFADKAWPRETGGLGLARFLFLAQNYRMSELQGAVALAQLGKVARTVARRRERAEQLNTAIAGMPEVAAPYVPANTKHSYWLYMLRVNEAAAGIGARQFGDALVAEGVPAWVQYIYDPLYLTAMFTERNTYGRSGYPLSEFAWQEYKRGLCPAAEQTLRTIIAVHWNENYTEEHVSEIAAAIAKVARHFARAAAAGR